MNISEISQEIHLNNVEKGFWPDNPKDRNVGELLMLVVSELSEALEADRKGEKVSLFSSDLNYVLTEKDDEVFKRDFEKYVKNRWEDEIADAVIRLFDIAVGTGISLEWHISAKMRYNKLRPYKHGKAY